MLWAALLLPRLGLDALARSAPDADPHMQNLALISRDQARPLIVDATPRLRAAGVRRGQTLAAAQALCPQLKTALHDPAQEQKLRELVAAWAYGYSSQVSLREDGAVLIEIGGSLGLFGPWAQLERRWRAELNALGVSHRLAVAPTALGALALARAHDGALVGNPATLRQALDALPIAHARFDALVVDALHGMGLSRLREVYALPRAGLIRRFGAALVDCLDRLSGAAPDPLSLYRPPDRFHARMEFDHEIESSEALRFPLRRLIDDLCAFLASRDGGVQQFDLVLEHDPLQFKQLAPTRLTVGLQSPQRDARSVFDLCVLRLQASTVPAPVRAFGIVAAHLPPFVPRARDLFDKTGGSQLDWPALADCLRNRLGPEAVYALAAADDPRPEHAWRKREAGPAPTSVRRPGLRPSWLLRRPLPLRNEPARILAGPERIEAGWWDGGDLRRDYYVIETREGQRAWAFRGIQGEASWLLHGWFA